MLPNFRRLMFAFGILASLLAGAAGAKAKIGGDTTATPGAQALKIYQTVRDQDYRAMYYLLAVTEKGKAMFGDVEQFAKDVKQGYEDGFKTPEEKAASDQLLASISDIMIGEAVITDNKAVVPTSAKITINGRVYTFRGAANLIQDEGVWKLDLTFNEDAAIAMEQRIVELLGKPDQPDQAEAAK